MEDKLYCDQCGKELVMGEEYLVIEIYNKHFIHEDCEDDYWDDLRDGCSRYEIRGEEENQC